MALEDRIRLPNLNLIHRRPRVLNLLQEFVNNGQRLITIYAPGGYGKSILLADFAQTTDLPVCWCSLEAPNRDPTSFLTLLAHSITDRFHEIEPEPLHKLVEQGDTPSSIRRISDLLAKVGPHIIIIDDYHKAVSAGMTLALNKLLTQLPPTSTLIVAARGDMALETGQILDLLMTDKASGLSEEELRFTGQEIMLVMRKRFGRRIDLKRADEIAGTTDGNIAQILLTGHIMHADKLVGRLRQHLGGDRDIIYDYLAAELFEKQPLELQEFMLYTAVLPDMTPELCNALLNMSNAQAFLERLVRADLFITRVGAGFKYHDLFAEFLRTRLAKDKTHYRQVAIKAANLLAKQSRFEAGMSLYLSVHAWDEAALLLETKGWSFYHTGRALTLDQWLAHMPEQELNYHPRLLLLRGHLLNDALGQSNQAITFFQRAEERFNQQDDLIGAAEAQIFRASVLRMMGQANESLVLCNKGLAQLEKLATPDQLIAWAINQRGHIHWTAGALTEALADFRRALKIFETLDNKYRIGTCHHDIGICLEKQGNIHGAAHHFKQAISIWEMLGNANDLANTLNSLGVSLHNVGRYDEAVQYFDDSLEIALKIGATRRAAFVQASLADTFLARQDYDRAIDAFTRSTELARSANIGSLEIYNQVKTGECRYRQHRLNEAFQLASQARALASETGLAFEQGLASVLQAKIYLHRAEYSASYHLFTEALKCFSNNDIIEQANVRLWWGYSLLLDSRSSAASQQMQEAITLILTTMGDPVPGLKPTLLATRPLLDHFLNRPDTPASTKDNIQTLLNHYPKQLDLESPDLQIFLFGPPIVTVSGRRKQFHQRGRIRILPEFLAYLILEDTGSGSRWSDVSAALWPDLKPDRASNLFHQNLRSLREIIFETQDYIIVQDDYYKLHPDYLAWCDAAIFNNLFERMTKTAPEEALELQLELIDLYQGEFLAGFELTDWGLICRTGYETRFLQVVEQAGEQLLKAQRPDETLVILNKGVTIDYFREALHRLAFRAYAQLNLYDHLSAYYADLCRIFNRELGVPPEPATEQLYQKLIKKIP